MRATVSVIALVASAAVIAGCGRSAAPASAPTLAEPIGSRDLPTVLRVEVARGPWAKDTATGFLLRSSRVITVAHVLGADGMDAHVSVRLPGARRDAIAARVVAVDQRDDLALLAVVRLPRPGGHGLRPSGRPAADPGRNRASVLVLRGGVMRALPARIRRSILAHIRTPNGRSVVDRPAIELGAELGPGDSGAPVVGADRQVLGVIFARSEPGADYAVTLSSRSAKDLLASG